MVASLPDPRELLRAELSRDARVLAAHPELARRKRERMSASAFAFLRGAAPLFYDLLRRAPGLAEGPPGRGWVLGDLHLENFGAYRVTSSKKRRGDDAIVFGPNDFDEAVVAPLRLDVLRLATSALLASRERGWSGARATSLARALIEAHAACLAGGRATPAPPVVGAVIDRARRRTRRELLDARTEGEGAERRFVRGQHYLACPSAALREEAERAFAAYASRLDPKQLPEGVDLTPIDVALRVAGTGSLGVLRLAVLVRGHGGEHGAWIFEMKEQPPPSSAILLGPSRPRGARRVLAAMDALLDAPLHLAGRARVEGRSLLVRRLAPQEDKVAVASVPDDQLEELALHLGSLAGLAHRRGAASPPRAWKRAEREQLVSSALVIAGVHEAAYLAFCDPPRAVR